MSIEGGLSTTDLSTAGEKLPRKHLFSPLICIKQDIKLAFRSSPYSTFNVESEQGRL